MQGTEDVRPIHVPQAQVEAAAARAPDRWSAEYGRPRRVAVRAALLHAVGLARRERDLGVEAHDRAAPADLEAVAGALTREQHLGDAEEAALEPALEAPQRCLAHREPAEEEILSEACLGEHERPAAGDGGHFGKEQPRVAAV